MSASSGQQVQSLRPPDLQGNKSSLFLHFSIFRATTASFQAFGHTSDPGQGENNKQLQVKLHIVHAHPPEKQLAKTWDRCWQQFSSYLRKQKLHKKLGLDVRVKHTSRFLKGCLTAENALVGRDGPRQK